MTAGSLDYDFTPGRRNYYQFVGFPWYVEAYLEDENGDRIDLSDYTIDSVTVNDDGGMGELTIKRSTTDATVFYYGQDATAASMNWLVTCAVPGGPAIPRYFGRINAQSLR